MLLPERARLLHVGLPKTGTTALQRMAVRRRGQLADAGVLYPRTLTKRHDHLLPAAALMGLKLATADGVPSIDHWHDLMARMENDRERRAWISHEWISESDDEQVGRFRDELGDRLHAVISVRHYGTILRSTWQEFLKSTMLHEFEDWIAYILTEAEAPDPQTAWQVEHVDLRAQQGTIVERWSRILGAENVTVIVVDPDHPDQLTNAFEDLLGLERGLLATQGSGTVANRSMTVEESSLMLALNRSYADPDSALMKRLGRLPIDIPRQLLRREPRGEERRLTFPTWAAELVDERSRRHADEIAATRVRVVGSLDALRAASRSTDAADHNRAAHVPVDAAVRVSEALAADAEDRVRNAPAADSSGPTAEDIRTAELAKEATRRVAARARDALRRGR
ncbi:hypothetical protein [Microbacterium karelineae]|uniref:hypothetical protein n=1 Tax=Microbacterium karelineae TaxID=2654283 RepID=UPI001E2ABB23|nr:hypothetical protein [Microbacterium karelineae]